MTKAAKTTWGLLELLESLPFRAILPGYPSVLYDSLLDGWSCVQLQAMTWRGPRTEKLWYSCRCPRSRLCSSTSRR